MRRLFLVLAGLSVAAVALLAFFPAALALRLLAPSVPGLTLDDARGTIWNGRVERVALSGERLGRLRWTADPRALLEGAYVADFVLEDGAAQAQGHLRRSRRELALHAVDARAPAAVFEAAFGAGLRPQGEVDLSIARARWRDDLLVSLDGRADWRDAALGGAVSARLGRIEAVFADAGGGRVQGEIRARDGAIDVEGGFGSDPLGWQVDLLLDARHTGVARMLQWFGEPAGPGRRRIRMEGAWQTATS